MVLATVDVGECNGAAPGTKQTTVTTLNMSIIDDYNQTPSSANAIPRAASPAGFGMEKFPILYCTAMNDSTLLDNFKVWKSNVEAYETGAILDYGSVIVAGYTTPTVSESIIATSPIPTTIPGSSNLEGSINADTTYNTYYSCLQYHADATHEPGLITDTIELTFQYDES